ncbi:MAG: AbrB/MazE/SpoVT family DNA-binding domain-containing protein [Spirochaetaceae bacterium]|jgi:antitoxin VapB|nr:AbrB/MazE/SpoVT family DNA-binding domain-containing protein [Spirochaetaceae bacterium]
MNKTFAKVFMNGRSQAIRLPKEFRVEGTEVYIVKDKDRLIITPKTKKEIFNEALEELFGCCPDFDTGRADIQDKPREVKL